MQKRGKLWLFFGAALLVLLLSALVETETGREAAQATQWKAWAVYEVAFLPVTAPVQQSMPLDALQAQTIRLMMAGVFLAIPLIGFRFFCRGANGRWLRKKRYVDSVYEVFRQEAACG